ncbi:hypothetical protein L9F63_015150 [Diploptera punctata]|uniref:Uncharacterized protein n=1 Tax=Diploptera punctata TaxID=6984 RepID=A0AAD8EJU7_DIPPU|nr:hypothetical protein L9F63_015150 [Diploptera punctata]
MLGLATPLSKSTPTPTYPSISSKSQDITIDTGPEITSASTPIATNLSTSSNEPSSGDSADISRIKADLSRTGQSSNSSVKEESSSPSVGKLDNSAKSFSTSSNNDPTPLLLHSSKSLDGSQTKFSSSSQKQVEDSKKLVNLSDIPNKSASLNKIAPAITTSEEAAEILLDMSTSQSLPAKPLTTESPQGKLATVPERAVAASAPSRRNTPPPPPPPSVQVHIVQSPAAAPTTASPMVIPSPHSASPCSIDDDLMDEALVGLGK